MKFNLTAASLAAVLGALVPQAANAAKVVPVTNPGMDFNFNGANPDHTLAPGQWATLDVSGATGTYKVADPVPGWIVAGPDAGVVLPTAAMFPGGFDGDVLYIGGTEATEGGFTQDFGTTKKNATYTITLDIGFRQDIECSGYVIQVLFNDVVKKTFQGSTDCHELTKGSLVPFSFSFASPGAKDLKVRLTTITPGANSQVNYDNFKLSYVPAAR